jgi:hypothetical protein
MADLTSTTTVVRKKGVKAAAQADTIGQVAVKYFEATIPNPANATDYFVVGKMPDGSGLTGVFVTANAAIASNTGVEWGLSANANGAGAVVGVANVATGVSATTWTYAPAVGLATAVPVGDSYLVGTIRGNSTTAVHTLKIAAVCVACAIDAGTYSTFTK